MESGFASVKALLLIIEYFVERAGGKLRPQEQEARVRYRFFLHHAEGSAMPPLLVQLLAEKIRAQKVPFFVRPITRRIGDGLEKSFSGPAIATHFGFVESELADRPYFAGSELSAADIQMIIRSKRRCFAAREIGRSSTPGESA